MNRTLWSETDPLCVEYCREPNQSIVVNLDPVARTSLTRLSLENATSGNPALRTRHDGSVLWRQAAAGGGYRG